jgi:magnesium chelatase subunit D
VANADPAHGAPFVRALAAAAVSPALRAVLCFDATPRSLLAIGRTFAELLRDADMIDVTRVVLGSSETNEDLWDAVTWSGSEAAAEFSPAPGLLGPSNPRVLKLVVIPDLPQLSLAATRACVMLLDAPVCHLERHGQSLRWTPAMAWLAGCPRELVGRVSPHLLDRFALRLQSPPERQTDRRVELLKALQSRRGLGDEDEFELRRNPSLPPARLRAARAAEPARLTSAARDALAQISVPLGAQGARRDIALGRLAVAVAKLRGAPQVSDEHVRDAAGLIGVRSAPQPSAVAAPAEIRQDAPVRSQPAPDATSQQTPTTADPDQTAALPAVESDELLEPDTTRRFDAAELRAGTDQAEDASPYPEDGAPNQRESEPLRLPPFARSQAAGRAGPAIGVQRSTNLDDLALTSTVVESLKWQRIRRSKRPDLAARTLIVSPDDLRSHRRAALSDQMLVLVLDFTSRNGWSWVDILLLFLRWAYTRRARVCLVSVGGSAAVNEIRATLLSARNLLDPRVESALAASAGQATPLAHGLELARLTLLRELYHRRPGVADAQLIVVTDGRGNVPLEASLRGEIIEAVAAGGVADSLAVAEKLAMLERAHCTVVDPEPAELSDLPAALARAMGAKLLPLSSVIAEPAVDVA